MPAVAYDSQRYAAHEREQLESKQTGTTFVNTRDEMYLALVRFAGIMKRTAEQLEGTDSVCLLVLRFSLLTFPSCCRRGVIGYKQVYHIISVPSFIFHIYICRYCDTRYTSTALCYQCEYGG